MHAKHADNSEPNDLSGHMIEFATVPPRRTTKTFWSVRISIGKPVPRDQTHCPWPMDRVELVCVFCMRRLPASALIPPLIDCDPFVTGGHAVAHLS